MNRKLDLNYFESVEKSRLIMFFFEKFLYKK